MYVRTGFPLTIWLCSFQARSFCLSEASFSMIFNIAFSFAIPDADLYEFGVLMSNVHNAWMRLLAGRLKSDYRYAKDIVYNTFPWPTPSEEQKKKIEETAQRILDIRNEFPNSSLAALYDPLTMPRKLHKAHIENDRAVMRAYGFSIKDTSEADCVAALMKMYQDLKQKQDIRN